MVDQKQHISLRRMEYERARYKPRRVSPPPERDITSHAQKLKQNLEKVRLQFQDTLHHTDLMMDPIQVIRVGAERKMDEDELRRSGLVLLNEDADKQIILLAKDHLAEIDRRVEEYGQAIPKGQKSPHYNNLIAPLTGDVENLTPKDRTGRKLGKTVIDSDSKYFLDVELWDTDEHDENDKRTEQFRRLVQQLGGRVTDSYIKQDLLLFRINILGQHIETILNENNIRMVDLPPEPSLASSVAVGRPLPDFAPPPAPPDDATGICIIDSGIMTQHPMLRVAIGDSKPFHNNLRDGIDEHGHGTMIAGVALYGDVQSCIESLSFEPHFYLYSARVLNKDNKFDDDRLVVSQMEEAIRYFHRQYGCRVFNISICDPEQVYANGKPSTWAHVLDVLAAELNIIIVVAAGNIAIHGRQGEMADHIFRNYPSYLLQGLEQDADTRILEPATAANVLTVGSLANADQSRIEYNNQGDLTHPLANIDGPSPFTRSGPGINKAIKPEIAEYGGNMLWRHLPQSIYADPQLGVISTQKDFLNRLFGTECGTSLAAPKVAHMAASILRQYPNASANLVRALIANSAVVPLAIEELVKNSRIEKQDVLRLCGYGKPDLNRALFSNETCVTLIADETIPLDGIHLYEIPIPKEFQELNGDRRISVSLAFDPPTRRTRYDYLGVRMDFRLFRGLETDQILDWFSERDDDYDPDTIEDRFQCRLEPTSQQREGGTLQKGVFTAKRNSVFTDYANNGGNFHLLVRCRPVWAVAEEFPQQRYSLAVTIEHRDGLIDLYNLVSQQIQVRARVRVRS